jgi:hypothetical protein
MPVLVILAIAMTACNLPWEAATQAPPTGEPAKIPISVPLSTATVPPPIPATATVAVSHTMTPADPQGGKLVYDVESAGTAPEKRAPYGDSYDINRLERPFLPDMSYIPDLDIAYFTVAKDSDWWYVSIQLNGTNPNNGLGIHYGVELDLDRDGFSDYLIWARPAYTEQWSTLPIQIYEDQNQNTGGLSAGKSDAPFSADGYETLIFEGIAGGSDPDLAWVRINAGVPGTVQFAFKRSWSGSVFMLGVIADGGLKDPKQLDYVDRFPLAEAGSPVKENMYYPLKALFLVDNTCREAFGFEPSRYELQICPVPVAPTRTPDPSEPDIPLGCPDPGPNVCRVWDPVKCVCLRK